LSFDGCYKITDEGLKNLFERLKSLSCLQTLDLKLLTGLTSIDLGRKYLWKELKTPSSLKSIHLNWRLQSITDEALQNISKGLKRFKSLKSLSLKFQSCSDIIDQGLESLTEALKGLHSLESISLDFDESCLGLTDQDLKRVNQALKKNKSLKSFSLWFMGSILQDDITDKGLGSLFQDFQSINSLEDIGLFLNICEITNEGLNSIAIDLKKMTCLRSIKLCFCNCPSITDTGIINLGEALKRISSLRNITVQLRHCYKITNEAREILYQDLLKLQSLESIDVSGF